MCTPPLFNILIIFIKANDTIGSSPQLGVRPGASILGWQGGSRHPNENIDGGQTYLPPPPNNLDILKIYSNERGGVKCTERHHKTIKPSTRI